MDATRFWTGEEHRDSPAYRGLLRRRELPRDQLRRAFCRAHGRHQLQGCRRAHHPRDLGQWKTPFWEGHENRGTLTRTGFQATPRINRHDLGVSWQDELPGGGVVVSNEIAVELNVEAILVDDLEATGAISYYR
jgi:hypothetical protein